MLILGLGLFIVVSPEYKCYCWYCIVSNIQQIINVSISLGDSMTVNIIREYVFVFVGAPILM